MYVIHFHLRKQFLVAGGAALALVLALILVLSGCQKQDSTPIPAGTEEQRLAYLKELGWTVEETPVETLDLLLPEKLEGEWQAYAKLQKSQDLPFGDFAGQTVRRYTYTVTNYPGIEKGVQVNLFVCGDQLIGGDIISLAENGFQTDLTFPQQDKT